jgi:tetratricopeptide (TPR) repeat protein
LQSGLGLQPSAPWRGKINLALAQIFTFQQNYQFAAAALEAALASQELELGETKEALYRLAQASRQLLQYDEALDALARLCSLDAGYLDAVTLVDRIHTEQILAEYQPTSIPYNPLTPLPKNEADHGEVSR